MTWCASEVRRCAVAAIGAGAWGLTLVACFPDFQVGASGGAGEGDAAAGDGGDARPPLDDGGTLALAGSTSGYVGYPSPEMLVVPYTVKHSGDLLVIATYIYNGSATVTGVHDSLGTALSSTPVQYGGMSASCSGFGLNAQFWYAKAAAAGSDTITVTKGGSDALGAFVLEYSGLGPGVSLDGTATAIGTVATPAMSGGNLSTSGTRDLVVALFANTADYGAMTAGSGFTARGVDTGFAALIEDDLPTGAGPGVHEASASQPPAVGDAGPDHGHECWLAVSAAFR